MHTNLMPTERQHSPHRLHDLHGLPQKELCLTTLTASVNTQLDHLLEEICLTLSLTETQYNLAKERYQAIGTWLSQSSSALYRFSPEVYPQGSLRLQTPVKPIARLEYDLDLICLLHLHPGFYQEPMIVYAMVEERLKANGLYRNKIERYKRCLRITYANEFHLDITPACPDPRMGGTYILVPDRKMHQWKPSNPIGYATWFDQRSSCRTDAFTAKRVEPLPPNELVPSKAPLRRVVQLLKRHRDVVFQGDEDAPRSIVLTTLAAQHYDGQRCITDALVGVLDKIVLSIASTPGRLAIPNPANPAERFCEAWANNPEAYHKFVDFLYALQRRFRKLLGQTGLANIAQSLQILFGESITVKAIEAYTDRMHHERTRQQIHFRTSGVGLTTATARTRPIPKNTFYGQ
jgi:hypothetical protein